MSRDPVATSFSGSGLQQAADTIRWAQRFVNQQPGKLARHEACDSRILLADLDLTPLDQPGDYL